MVVSKQIDRPCYENDIMSKTAYLICLPWTQQDVLRRVSRGQASTGNLLELPSQRIAWTAPDALDELLHDLLLKSALDDGQRIWMLRVGPVAQPINSKGVVTLQTGKRMPVVIVTEAEARPHSLIVGDAMDEDFQDGFISDEDGLAEETVDGVCAAISSVPPGWEGPCWKGHC